MTFSPLMPARVVSKYALFFLIGLASFNLSAQTSGLHIGAYHEDPTANPEDPTPGLLYLNLPAGDQSFKGLMDFTFVGCQSKSVGEIKGEKIKGSLKGEWSGPVDYTYQTGSYIGRFIAKDKYYTGTYAVNKGKQFVKVPNCIEYYIAPHGTWSIFELNHTFSESKPFEPISVVDGVAKWSMPPGTTIASISLVDKELAVSGAKNAVLHQLIIPASLKNYRLPPQYAKSGKTYVISVIASNGRKVVYFSSIEFPEKTDGNSGSGREAPLTIKGDNNKDNNTKPAPDTTTSAVIFDGKGTSSSSVNAPEQPSFGSKENNPSVTEPETAVCRGRYEGHYDGELGGVLRVDVDSSGKFSWGFGATGGYNENVKVEDWIKRGEGKGVKMFLLTARSATEDCQIEFSGTWIAPLFSGLSGVKHYLRFSGQADGDYLYGEFRFTDNPKDEIIGRFRLEKVK